MCLSRYDATPISPLFSNHPEYQLDGLIIITRKNNVCTFIRANSTIAGHSTHFSFVPMACMNERQQQELHWFKQNQLRHICSELRNNLQVCHKTFSLNNQTCLLFITKSKAGKEEDLDGNLPVMKLKDTRLVQFESPGHEKLNFY